MTELMELEPIARESVAEQVARRILGLVKSGSLKPGDQLPTERELAATLQVSRPSVREALRGLAILGVVKTRQGGGAFISSLDAWSLLEPLQFFISLNIYNVDALYEARLMIEDNVARFAAARISDDDIAKLRELLGPQKALVSDPAGFRKSDYVFHAIIWTAANNPFLERIADSLNVLGMEFRKVRSETPDMLQQSYRDHVAIVDALAARDPDRAAQAMEAHMHHVHRSTLQAMEKDKWADKRA